MPASSARIGFVTQEFRTVVASDSAVKTAYGSAARDTKEDVAETFFDDPDDAQAIADERLSLLSPNRRRFRQDVSQLLSFTGALDFSQTTPAATVIDDDHDANHAAAIVEIGLRFADQKTTIITWG